MKYVKLFENFVQTEILSEDAALDAFYAKKVKNPETGREVTIGTILGDPENPMYKKVKAAETKFKEQLDAKDDGGIDREEIEDQIDSLEPSLEEAIDDVKDYTRMLNKAKAEFDSGLQQFKKDQKSMGDFVSDEASREEWADMEGEEIQEEIDEYEEKLKEATTRKAAIEEEIAELRAKLEK